MRSTEPNFQLPAHAFDDIHTASTYIDSSSSLRVEMDFPLDQIPSDAWDKELYLQLTESGGAKLPLQYSFSRVLVED